MHGMFHDYINENVKNIIDLTVELCKIPYGNADLVFSRKY